MKKLIKRYFITGLLILVPLYITGYVLLLIVGFMDSLLKFLPEVIRPETYLPFHVPGLGIIVTIVVVFLVGVLGANFFGKRLIRIGEWFLSKIPLIRSVYKASKQFLETFFLKDQEDGFRKVVLLEYPRRGMYGFGFVTGKTRGEVQRLTGENTINVFIPTTPNPTSGFYFAVPEKELTPLNMTVEEAFKMIMSGGMVMPEELADKIDESGKIIDE
ncbi:MAG: DUF502 domain-containing protein [Deltaproteobacteria bacterium]|nr:DUF502 domain-containing protein [Deltaproteobacteria bacterium]